jgi:tetratricopeptide (TPR) repeat protein
MSGKKKTIESVLKDKTEAQLRQLLIDISKRFPDASDFILRWSQSKGQMDVTGELAMALWEKAEIIIDQFNEYGGGSDDDEEAACDYICEMSKLIPKLSWEARQKIVDRMLEQYSYGNSGFEDMLIETCYEMCNEKDELVYLAERFLSSGKLWDKRRAMTIYRRIGEYDKYLQLRTSSLEFRNDYLDLAEYYEEQGDIETALEVAKKGLHKGEKYLKTPLFGSKN